MILEVKHFPESQEVMEDPEWFLIMDTDPNENKLGQSSYARILDETDYMLISKELLNQIGKEHATDNRIGERRDTTTNGRRTGFQRRKLNERRTRE